MPDPTVFVANSDSTVLTLLHALLTEAGIATTISLTDETTHARIRQLQPHLVILDVGVRAAAAGWTLLKLLQLDPYTRHIRVLITTLDHAFIQDKRVFLQALGYDVVELSVSFDDLLPTVRTMLEPR